MLNTSTLLVLLVLMAGGAYVVGRQRAWTLAQDAGGIRTLKSLPGHYGLYTALWALIPALILIALWSFVQPRVIDGLLITPLLPESVQVAQDNARRLYMNTIVNHVNTHSIEQLSDSTQRHIANRLQNANTIGSMLQALVVLGTALYLAWRAWQRVLPTFAARAPVERVVRVLLAASASIAILTTLGIFLSVIFESLRFFKEVPFLDFVAGLSWSPQTAIRADQAGSSGSFGAVPLFVGTLLISLIAMVVAVPFGLFSAIYLAEYATPRVRSIVKPLLEILAGIPTVVYGFFAALTVAPALRNIGEAIGLSVASESALAAGAVMGIMIIPFVSSLSDDVITAVPQSMRDGSLALGSTQSETIRKVVIPAALPGIVGGILLAVSRAIGETMIVVMAAGLAAKLTFNPLDAVTTVTVQIVTLLTGDQEFDSAKTLSAFALGLMLFLVTLILNVIALYVVRRYREQYE